MPIRKKNSKRLEPSYVEFVQHYERKRIETVGSLIERVLPKHIHAVTETIDMGKENGCEIDLTAVFCMTVPRVLKSCSIGT